MKKIERKKRKTETFDIEGSKFEVDVSTKNVKEAILKGHELQEMGKKIEEMPFGSTKEEQLKAVEEMENLLWHTTDYVLGDGSFDILYPKAEEDIFTLGDWIFQVIDHLYDLQQKEAEKQKAKYVKNRKR